MGTGDKQKTGLIWRLSKEEIISELHKRGAQFNRNRNSGKNSDNNKLIRENAGIAAVAATLETSAQALCKVNKVRYVLAVETLGILDTRANFETLHVTNVKKGSH